MLPIGPPAHVREVVECVRGGGRDDDHRADAGAVEARGLPAHERRGRGRLHIASKRARNRRRGSLQGACNSVTVACLTVVSRPRVRRETPHASLRPDDKETFIGGRQVAFTDRTVDVRGLRGVSSPSPQKIRNSTRAGASPTSRSVARTAGARARRAAATRAAAVAAAVVAVAVTRPARARCTRRQCANCGKETEVPFQPRGDRPVYCRDCFQQRAPSGGGYGRSGGGGGGGRRY